MATRIKTAIFKPEAKQRRARVLKGLKVPLITKRPGIRYDPVDTSKKFTEVFILRWDYSSPLELVGYCVEPPMEVLQRVYGTHFVSQYKMANLFRSDDFDDYGPSKGLTIREIEPVFGITGTIEEMLKEEAMKSVRRRGKVSPEEVARFFKERERFVADPHPALDKGYKQYVHDYEEVESVVKQYERKKR